MTIAWYGHLRFGEMKIFKEHGLWMIILVSWLVALFEYCVMVPANRIGFRDNGGPFSLFELKIIQEAVSLIVFTVFAVTIFKTETLRLNHLYGFVFLLLAVYFIFKK